MYVCLHLFRKYLFDFNHHSYKIAPQTIVLMKRVTYLEMLNFVTPENIADIAYFEGKRLASRF